MEKPNRCNGVPLDVQSKLVKRFHFLDTRVGISRTSEISATVAAAIEEQGAATQEIPRNVQQAAHGTHQVSSNITDVQRGATETGSASPQVLSAARSLSGNSTRLKAEVSKFLSSVRAA